MIYFFIIVVITILLFLIKMFIKQNKKIVKVTQEVAILKMQIENRKE